MFVIYEEKYRYITQDTSKIELGYVETENEAKEICDKLNNSVKEKNEINTMGNWRYYFKKLEYFNIDDNRVVS